MAKLWIKSLEIYNLWQDLKIGRVFSGNAYPQQGLKSYGERRRHGSLIRKSKDYIYCKWVYKVLGIWKGYCRVKKIITSFMHETMNQAKK